jgi:hypothetical protein
MFGSIPKDVWIAAALAFAIAMAAIFGPVPVVFVTVYIAVCAYILIQVFGRK